VHGGRLRGVANLDVSHLSKQRWPDGATTFIIMTFNRMTLWKMALALTEREGSGPLTKGEGSLWL
jgi:hypothetical protein